MNQVHISNLNIVKIKGVLRKKSNISMKIYRRIKVVPVPVMAWGFFYCPPRRLRGQIGAGYEKRYNGKSQESPG